MELEASKIAMGFLLFTLVLLSITGPVSTARSDVDEAENVTDTGATTAASQDVADGEANPAYVTEKSKITCYTCDSNVRNCSAEHKNAFNRTACPYPQNACMKATTLGYDVKREVVTKIVSRICAEVKDEDVGCSSTDGANTLYTECFCKSDLCNSGHVTVTSFATYALAAALTSMLRFCY